MINNIEYNKIIEFINEDLINNKIKNNSKISRSLFGSLFGGSSSSSEINRSDKLKNDMTNSILGSLTSGFNIPGYNYNTKISDIISKNNTSGMLIIVPVIGYAINNLFENKDKISSNDFILNVVKLISMGGLCLGVTSGLDIFKYIKNVFSIGDILGSFANTGIKTSMNVSKVLETMDFTKILSGAGSSNLVGGSMLGLDYLQNLVNYVWKSIQQMYNNSIIQKTIEKFKNWIMSNNTSISVPEIDKETNNEMDKIIKEVINQDVKTMDIKSNYYFDKSSGNIIYNGPTNFKEIKTIISINDRYYIKSIEMITNKDKSIDYFMNNSDTKIDSTSYIQGYPVHTALVFAYMSKEHQVIINHANKYVYKMEDGNVQIYMKDGNNELPTITRAISLHKENEVNKGMEYIKQTCKEMFGYDEGMSNNTCAKHFYSILGRSAINMVQNLEKEMEERPNMFNLLLSSNVGIQYEILKNLDWKIKKNSKNNLELIGVEEWLNIKNDLEYKKYLKEKPKIKELLNRMIEKINLEKDLIENFVSDHNAESQKETNINTKRRIKKETMNLSKEKLNNLQYISLMENFILANTSYTQIGGKRRDVFSDLEFNKNEKQFNFKFMNNLDEKYILLKEQLESVNKKLSNETDNQINTKIQEIKALEKDLELIYNKILKYLKIIHTDKNAYLNNKYLDINEIDNLIEQYNTFSNKKSKKLVKIITAFGQLQIVLEDNDSIAPLNRQYYHNI